jgi:putative phosphoesterase
LSRNCGVQHRRSRGTVQGWPAFDGLTRFPDECEVENIIPNDEKNGHLRAGVQNAFEKVDLIIHAGDIGDEKVLRELSQISPIVAVRGNMDFGKWANNLPKSEFIEIGPIGVYVLHIANRLEVAPGNSQFKAIISGHTHRSDVYEKNGITFLNPGSASYPKFGHPASVALLKLHRHGLNVRLIELTD